jgi:dienelactone hydrolase
VFAGIAFLTESEGIRKIGLVRHSFGGAVVLQAVSIAQPYVVSTIVTLAAQSYGATDAIPKIKESRVLLLLIHGTRDRVLPVRCSEQIHQMASEPKRLVVFKLVMVWMRLQSKYTDWFMSGWSLRVASIHFVNTIIEMKSLEIFS